MTSPVRTGTVALATPPPPGLPLADPFAVFASAPATSMRAVLQAPPGTVNPLTDLLQWNVCFCAVSGEAAGTPPPTPPTPPTTNAVATMQLTALTHDRTRRTPLPTRLPMTEQHGRALSRFAITLCAAMARFGGG
jgi:hypothetical protein